jgi:hypothetical protein
MCVQMCMRLHNIRPASFVCARLEMPWGRNECSNGNACVTGVNMDDRTKTSTMGATHHVITVEILCGKTGRPCWRSPWALVLI